MWCKHDWDNAWKGLWYSHDHIDLFTNKIQFLHEFSSISRLPSSFFPFFKSHFFFFLIHYVTGLFGYGLYLKVNITLVPDFSSQKQMFLNNFIKRKGSIQTGPMYVWLQSWTMNEKIMNICETLKKDNAQLVIDVLSLSLLFILHKELDSMEKLKK